MNPKSYRRTGNTSSLIKNEMRSWSKNKMEDRKLALLNEQTDKRMLGRRKSHQYEKDLVNKNFEEKFCKTTPSMDEYLDRSYSRYNGWRERERERLDRRYRSLYKSYLSDYKRLSIQEYAPRQTPGTPGTPMVYVTDEDADNTQDADALAPSETPVDKIDQSDQSDEHQELLSLDKFNIDMNYRRFSTTNTSSPTTLTVPKRRKRRRSTGSIATRDMSDQKLKESTTLPKLREHLVTEVEQTDGVISEKQTCSTDDENDTITSLEELKLSKQYKVSRRASVAIAASRPVYATISKRLDRRSSIPNIAIPMNYGN